MCRFMSRLCEILLYINLIKELRNALCTNSLLTQELNQDFTVHDDQIEIFKNFRRLII